MAQNDTGRGTSFLTQGQAVEPDGRRELLKAEPLNLEASARALAEPITATDEHYVRTNFPMPDLAPEAHRLEIGGAVANPITLRLDALRRMPQKTLTVTLECAGNHRLGMAPLPSGELWDRGAVSTASWTGVPLRHLLEQVGVRDDVVELLFEGADAGTLSGVQGTTSFARSLPLDKALDPDTLLALDMNGQPLPKRHGAPLRLVVPGWYGMASVKWVRRIEARTVLFEGYFQSQRYVYEDAQGSVPVTQAKVKAMLMGPEAAPRGVVEVWGWAWSGEAAITLVEVSLDGADTWVPAKLEPVATEHAWTRWSVRLRLDGVGRHSVRARASDARGNVQPAVPPWNRLGYGNNSVQVWVLRVH